MRIKQHLSSPSSTADVYRVNTDNITSLDPEQIAAAAASTHLTAAHFLVADATHLPFADHEFDLVSTSKTIHHIRDWPQALAEMIRVLKPGGRLLYPAFLAPRGERLPTRRSLGRFVAEQRLETVWRSGPPPRLGRDSGRGHRADTGGLLSPTP